MTPYKKIRLSHGLCWINPDLAANLNTGHDANAPGKLIDTILNDGQVQHTYKDQPDSQVHVVHAANAQWIVKRIKLNAIKRWLYRTFRCGSAWQQWRGAVGLQSMGCRVSTPLAIVHQHRKQIIILPFIPGVSLFRYLRGWIEVDWQNEPPTCGRAAMAAVIGRQIGKLTAAGIVNRDHKASNLLIDESCYLRGLEPVLIDLAGLRRRRSHAHVLRMLAILLTSVTQADPVNTRWAMRCLKAAIQTDPSLTPGGPHPVKTLAQQVLSRR